MKKTVFYLILSCSILSGTYSYGQIKPENPVNSAENQAFIAAQKAAVTTWYENQKQRCLQKIAQYSHFITKNTSLKNGAKLALAAGCACLLYANRVYLAATFLGGRWLLRDSINVGGSVCNGRNHDPLANNVFLRQIAVPEQRGLSCGYHALRNAIVMVDGVQQGHADMQDRLDGNVEGVASVDALIGDQKAPWRAVVNNAQQAIGDGQQPMLDIQEINALRADEQVYHRISAPHFDPAQSITVVDNIDLLRMNDLQALAFGLNFQPIRQGRLAARAQQPPVDYAHGFVLGNMQQDGDYMGKGGHWISVLLHQKPDGVTEYTVTDSRKNDLAMDTVPVRRLIENLEG